MAATCLVLLPSRFLMRFANCSYHSDISGPDNDTTRFLPSTRQAFAPALPSAETRQKFDAAVRAFLHECLMPAWPLRLHNHPYCRPLPMIILRRPRADSGEHGKAQLLPHPHGRSNLSHFGGNRPRFDCPEGIQVCPPQVREQQGIPSVPSRRPTAAQLPEQTAIALERTHEVVTASSLQVTLFLPLNQQLLTVSIEGALHEESDGSGGPVATRAPRPLAWNEPWSEPPKIEDRVREAGPSCAYLTASCPGPP